ncbi:putative ABC transporter [Candidatus Vecturithrix granuli]|uniref:Putative ABC transporter n=1 Tax=Vecturithrix granuli TaxID=1499967 RepID=A0A081C676_VECG1|nr:putative ABC transporter [Candidatus Vecturithrix granuli]
MHSLRQLASFLRPYWRYAMICPLLMIVEVAMDLLQPKLMQQIVDVGIVRLDLTMVLHTGMLMISVALIGLLGGGGNTIFAVKVAQGVSADVRSTLFRKVLSFSFGNLDTLKTGELVTRLTNDVNQVQEVVLILFRILLRAPLMLIGSIIMAVFTSPRLAVIVFLLLPVLAGLLLWVLRSVQPMFAEVQRRLDVINTILQENLAGMRVVKAFVRADYEEHRFARVNDDLMAQTIRAIRLMAIVMPGMTLVLNLGIVGAIWFGGLQVMYGNMQVGQIIAFVNYLLRTLFAVVMVGMLLVRVSRAEASAERILEVLHSQPEITDKPDALAAFTPQGRVTFEHVAFNYNGNRHEPVLQDIHFTAEPGQTVAILGATGSGKSSLVHLIPRYYDVSAGRVLIDGVDVRDINLTVLHRRIAVVFQEAVLFSGTIRENICYGRPEATEEEMITAAKAAQAHEFISAFPDGYATLVGQRGVNLSGGQKQRIAIARALLTNPAILILDDSTSAVDIETEGKIQNALAVLMQGRTSFVIAQRISTVLTADKILVLDEGRLVAEGKHCDLMTSSTVYREIYESQLGGRGMAL